MQYQFSSFTLDVFRGCLLKNGEEIKLRPKVYETLKHLVERPGQLISKQELMEAVWPDSVVTDDSLVQCTLELRRALNDRSQQLLKTVPRRGYLFVAEVKQRSPEKDSEASEESLDASARHKQQASRIPKRRQELPSPRSSFVGREEQIADVTGLLLRPDVRLLTLTGPGGAGKSRLAIAVASAIADRFSAGVQFVGLAAVTDPGLVGSAIADALGIQQLAHCAIPKLIADELNHSGSFLLLLDNFEQLLPAASVMAEILEACPSLKILVTSRSCLRLYGEQEFPVAALAARSAMDLFAQRAAAVWPEFVITHENAATIQEICSRLDGLPLAIELAAARTKVLSPLAILDRLQSRLELLTGGALDLPARQQTLRKTIDWSHDLLNDAEAKLFRRLSVFVGGCTLEAAEAVCDTRQDLGLDLFEGLCSLVDKNLIQRVDGTGTEPRFGLLETIREYALERLSASGEQPAVRRAHAAFCLVLAEEGNPESSLPERALWLTQCDAEIYNFRSALDWLFRSGDLDWSLRLCSALFRFWDMREHLTEGRFRLETVLRLAGTAYPKQRARVSQFLGALATGQGDYAAAETYLQQGLALYEEAGDDWGIAASLNALAASARDRGDYASAQSNFERSLACWRLLPDRLATARCLHNLANVVKGRGDYRRARWALQEAAEILQELGDVNGCAWSTNQQGDIARAQGDLAAAKVLYGRALSSFRESGDPWGIGRSLTDLATIHCAEGDHPAGHAACRESAEIFAGLGHRRGVARVLEASACLALAEGQARRALKLAAAAAHLRKTVSAHLHQPDQSTLDQTLLPAWNALSESEGKRAWAEGSEMTLESALQYSLEQSCSSIAQ